MTRAHIITGSFGAGKTTAIRRLMAEKPEQELWVVILNEFTDAGLDALTVAQAARGEYDVRLIAGGCLCCVGELEFGRQLDQLLGQINPARLLIEPSGAGHAGDIVDELAAYETKYGLSLDSVVCLIDPIDALHLAAAHQRSGDSTAWSQVQAADALLLSKADIADGAARAAFDAIVAAQYPAKAFVGSSSQGAIPHAALGPFERGPSFSLLRPATSAAGTAAAPTSVPFPIGGHAGIEHRTAQLGLQAYSWILPRELAFSRDLLEPRLVWLLEAHGGEIARFKGLFRAHLGPSWLAQSYGRGVHGEASAYRRDSRVEIVFSRGPSPQILAEWRGLLRDAI